MTFKPKNINEFGHEYEKEQEALILRFPDGKLIEKQDQETETVFVGKYSKTTVAGLGIAAVYSMSVLGYLGYDAYKTLEGNDVLYANITCGAFVAGGAVMGAAWIVDKLN